MKYKLIITLSLFLLALTGLSWGFFAHQRINRLAVFSLPPEMIGFYKHNIRYVTEKAINPDQRRYVVEEEAPRHYIDLDIYGDSAAYKLPRYWNQAVEEYTEDTLQAYGIVPWHVHRVKGWLTTAFTNQDKDQILRLSADLGHYIADANVPLHTTENYNGQLTDQYGIHGFWESRLPELFSEDYQFFVGKAEYIPNTQLRIWEAVTEANLALDSVFRFERELTKSRGSATKFVIEQRGNSNLRTYSQEFSKAYHDKLNGMVEHRMRASIKLIADFWYTCWVDGGQPDLDKLIDQPAKSKDEALAKGKEDVKLRNHESGEVVNDKSNG